MRTIVTRKIAALAAFTAVLVFTACNREKNDTVSADATEDTGYADDMARMEQTFNDVQNLADQADATGAVQLKGGSVPLSGCASVLRDTVSIPHTITIDFGSTNCTCMDGRTRRGQIIVSYMGRYRDSGYVHTIGFNNYYVNDNHVLGTKSVTNMGHNSAGQLYYNISINGMMVLNATGDTVKHTASRTRTWVNGESTAQLSDDAYRISGSGSITKATGKIFNISITSPLLVAMNCKWIEEGTVAITPQGATNARILDYGNGSCDDQATITVNGKSKTIILR